MWAGIARVRVVRGENRLVFPHKLPAPEREPRLILIRVHASKTAASTSTSPWANRHRHWRPTTLCPRSLHDPVKLTSTGTSFWRSKQSLHGACPRMLLLIIGAEIRRGEWDAKFLTSFRPELRLSQTDFEKERDQAWGLKRDAVGAASELQAVSGPAPDS